MDIGGYDALRRINSFVDNAHVQHSFIGTQFDISDETGLTLKVHSVYTDLTDFDLLYIPGGYGTRDLVDNECFIKYLQTWGTARPLVSVCSGALLLGCAGYLRGLPATTHHKAFDELRAYCGQVVTDKRVVDAGQVITAGGVTSSLDLGLYLVERFWGRKAREAIATQMEYKTGMRRTHE